MKITIEQRILALIYSQPNLNISAIAYLLVANYIWVTKTIKVLAKGGFVKLEKHGRNKTLILTDKGNYFAKRIYEMQSYG
jgi:predicted transcriptional regulator